MNMASEGSAPGSAPTPASTTDGLATPRGSPVPSTPVVAMVSSSPSEKSPPVHEKGSREPGPEEFVCDRCSLIVPRSALPAASRGKRTGVLIEEVCLQNYKCLARRWAGKPHLRAWWEAKGPDGQRSWYRFGNRPLRQAHRHIPRNRQTLATLASFRKGCRQGCRKPGLLEHCGSQACELPPPWVASRRFVLGVLLLVVSPVQDGVTHDSSGRGRIS